MSDQPPGFQNLPLPDAPSLAWLRKRAKHRLAELRETNSSAKLADAQFDLAKQYGFPSWRALKAKVESATVDGRLFQATRNGDVVRLGELLDEYPAKLHVRDKPYEWTLLHAAAREGHLATVDVLLRHGLDVNVRESGDNTCPLHWAAAAGHLEVVRRLVDAGGDVVGHGDDHQLEVIGWATCWDGCDDAAHRAVADFIISRGARHHIFSAIALNLAEEVRRLVAQDPSTLNRRMSRHEDHQMPLHFAVRMNRPQMVSLLLDLGADPLAVDGSGYSPAVHAASPSVDIQLMEAIRAMTSAELVSAMRAHRRPRVGMMDVVAVLSLADWETAARLVNEDPGLLASGGPSAGALHVMAKRGDARAVKWLLDHGADPNARWPHWDAQVTPLHLAVSRGHEQVLRRLLAAGADPTIRDSKHDGDAMGWAEHFGQPEMLQILRASMKEL